MNAKTTLLHGAGKAVKKAAPTILTVVSAAGVVATAALAVRATPKALKRIEAAKAVKKAENGGNLTRMETIGACWQCYVPAAATGIAVIGCIFGANALNRRQQAALVSAYALVIRSYNDYQRKVKELHGVDAHRRIMEALAAEKSKKQPIYAGTLIGSSSLDFEDAGEEERLFYDAISERYFQATISQVLQAEYHLNRNFALGGGFITLNQFYEFLGIEPVPGGDEVGWMVSDGLYWVDFDHQKTVVDDGLNGEVECYIIDAPFPPVSEREYEDMELRGLRRNCISYYGESIFNRRFDFMDSKTIFKVLSFVGMALGGIGTLLSAWADGREQDAIIEEKINEALAAREHGEKESEEP